MAKKSTKFFRIATEGATADGRTISAQMLEQMAATYDPQRYGARINLEHYRGVDPDGIFKRYGDVIALKTEKNSEGKVQLLAQLDPTDDLIKMTNEKRQKVFSSMEVDPDFAKSGQAYLVGLAVTDNPASLGTEMLEFSAKATNSPLAARKTRPENLFTAAEPFAFELDDESPVASSGMTLSFSGDTPSFMEKFFGMFGMKAPTSEIATPSPAQQFAHEQGARADVNEAAKKVIDEFGTLLIGALNPIKEDFQKLRDDHNALVQKLSTTDVSAPRTAATGTKSANLTDC